ncbi:hypothetical protein Tco_0680991 [Tanacetum coccineum]|uniref:Reverse transcriptase domain-containing protein n=1 Tax=Tanacetum coccineum TaxID=301880 RepID=A0ABQ4XMY4_9ASTR
MKIEESLNMTFDETPPPSNTSPLVDDDLDEEEATKVTEDVIGNHNQRTLRSQAQNQSKFFCFIATIEPKNVNGALVDEIEASHISIPEARQLRGAWRLLIPEVRGIDTDILLTIKDDILREKLLNVNLLIAKIEALKDNPTPSSDFVTKSSSTSLNLFLEEANTFDNSLPETKTFCFNLEEISSGNTTTRSDLSLPDYEACYFDDDHIEEKSSGSITTHADFSYDFYHEEFAGELAHIISPLEYDHFYFKIEPELGNFTMDVVEDIFDNPTREPRVHVSNVLPTHPTLHLDSDFTISSDSLRSDLVVSFPSGTRNKIFDPGIFIGVQSKIFLSRDAFSISFIRDPLFLVIDTLLPFSSEKEDKVVNTGILVAGEEQSPHLSSHRGLKALNESPMMISGGDTPILDVSFLHFYPPDQLKALVILAAKVGMCERKVATWDDLAFNKSLFSGLET